MSPLTRVTGAVGFDEPATDLTTFPTTRGQRRTATLLAAVVLAMTGAAVPFGNVRLPASPTFLVAQATAAAVLFLIAGYLLWRQAVNGNSPPLALVASGYLIGGVLQTGFLVTAPDRPNAMSGIIGNQAAPFYSVCALLLFGTCVLASFLVRGRTRYLAATAAQREAAVTWIVRGAGAFVVLILAVGLALHAVPDLLLRADQTVKPSLSTLNAVAVGLLLVTLALVVRHDRGRTVINLWVTLTLLGLACTAALLFESVGRYSIAWYVARIDGLFAPAAMTFAVVYEGARLGALIERTQRGLRSLVDGMTDALLVVDANNRVVQANPAAVTLFGYTTAEFVGLDIDLLVPRVSELPRGTRRVELRARREDGDLFAVEIAVGESARDETSSRTIIVRDITQRMRAEAATRLARDRALEATRVKSEFLATMSHEIRTPINAVIGMSELLLEGDLAGEQREYAQTVRDSAATLLAIINDILDFSKLEAGKMTLDAFAFSPVAAVEGAADILAAEARKKSLSLVTYIAPDVPEELVGDAGRLRQVLLNLIGNAIKFTREGGIVVHARLARETEAEVLLHVSVADSGIGLTEETRSRLFEAFVQADGSTSRQFGGTGLGLSISRRLVEMMGGEIGVESVEGVGSTFWFTASFVRGEPHPAREIMDHPVFLPPLHVLAIDDDPDARAIVVRYLRTWGIACDEADTASGALAMLENAAERGVPYDVALSDMRLPDRDGLALLSDVRANPAIAATRFILVTAYDETGRGAEAIAQGYAAYLRKPFRRAALYEALLGSNGSASPATDRPLLTLANDLTASTLRILLVEDHPVNRRLVVKQLEKLGFAAADVVTDGSEAIEATARTLYDIVLMDCQMPVVDGFTATRAIRSREKATGQHVPIVALTANALEGDREACIAAGMDAYLSKPVQLADLREAITTYAAGIVTAHPYASGELLQ